MKLAVSLILSMNINEIGSVNIPINNIFYFRTVQKL